MSQEIIKELIIEKIDINGNLTIDEDFVICEERVDFYLNGCKLISVMCLPQNQDAHIVGFLMSEGVLEDINDITSLTISDDGLSVYLDAKINEQNIQNLFKEKTLTTGCCVGVTGNIEDKILKEFNRSTLKYSYDELFGAIKSFYEDSELFDKTGCVHKAMLMLQNGKSIVSEDVGRHNAIDKTIGKTRLLNLDTHGSFLVVSGRLSMEMIIKCVMHKIPLVISKAAPTHLGIKAALEHGVTLIGFARNGKMNVYTHSGRILLAAKESKQLEFV
ncbi:MAG: hypothetical protein RL154_1587 [Pseudomonadota bacterium]|jgi:FdhD protein